MKGVKGPGCLDDAHVLELLMLTEFLMFLGEIRVKGVKGSGAARCMCSNRANASSCFFYYFGTSMVLVLNRHWNRHISVAFYVPVGKSNTFVGFLISTTLPQKEPSMLVFPTGTSLAALIRRPQLCRFRNQNRHLYTICKKIRPGLN